MSYSFFELTLVSPMTRLLLLVLLGQMPLCFVFVLEGAYVLSEFILPCSNVHFELFLAGA
jgi:hypothetical protein